MNLRPATADDIDAIWSILQAGIEKRRQEGSTQWQNGYPNRNSIVSDIEADNAYVMTENGVIYGYSALIVGIEPPYEVIEGKWLSPSGTPYATLHRIGTLASSNPNAAAESAGAAASDEALAQPPAKKGLGTALMALLVEEAKRKGLTSVRVDTSFDNPAMLRVFEKLGFVYCGEVIMGGSPRKAFEKILS